jgi:type IX secretion system substrate protein
MKFVIYIAILALCVPFVLSAQNNRKNKELIRLTAEDSIYSSKLKKITLPEDYKLRNPLELPQVLNNADLPFFRPTFAQGPYWNCGQATGVGYNFTYEINRVRGVNADTSINQYSPNFTFNFLNYGYGAGVSYFNSFDILKACGNPNLYDYGGLLSKGGTGWMSSYGFYENAMRVRVKDVFAIDVSTPEGLNTLKYWLLDHLDGSEYGGVASFYLTNYNAGSLPPDSPDAGFEVFYHCPEVPAGHAMTIVGFNDSIRYDINHDGRYTNDVDLNGDDIIDLKDSEFGGMRYVNSSLNNNGAGYIMYRTLALEYGHGGIWNQEVHVITVKTDYEPLANLRLKLKYNSRNKIKITAGVSSDIESNYPEHTMDFPIFNFQGGDFYMQGYDTSESQKIIELALDISPLYSYINTSEPAKFFVQLIENDAPNTGEGEILHYSLVANSDTANKIVCSDVPVSINNNSTTTLQITHNPNFNKVSITTEDLPSLEPEVTNYVDIVAESGYPPYSWDILTQYSMNPVNSDFQIIDSEKLEFENNDDSSVEIDLPFGFPFYGDTMNSIEVFIDGFIMFEKIPYPYPYYLGEESIIKSKSTIAPFMSLLILQNDKNDGIWIDKCEDFVKIRWKASCERYFIYNDVNFCLYLYPDGKIETQYDLMDYPDEILYAAGISAGDGVNYIMNNKHQDYQALAYSGYRYIPPSSIPNDMSINEEGRLSLNVNKSSYTYPVNIQVTDSKGIYDSKSFDVTTSDLEIKYLINSSDEFNINSNESSHISVNIRNNSVNSFDNVYLKLTSNDSLITITNSLVSIGPIEPEQKIEIEDIAEFSVSQFVPNNHNSQIVCELLTENENLITNINLLVKAPDLKIIKTQIIDSNNGVLYPGETATLRLTLQNKGKLRSQELQARIKTSDPEIYISSYIANISQLNPGDTISLDYTISTTFNIPMGTLKELELKIHSDETILHRFNTDIRIGHIPVLIVDFDNNQSSGLKLKELIDQLGLQSTYSQYSYRNFNDYLSVFICQGGLHHNNFITDRAGNQLYDYLTSSGNLYIEGRSAWTEEKQSVIHPMFNFVAETPSEYYALDTIIGAAHPFTDNMTFEVNDGVPYINYFLHPRDEAFTVFKTKTNDSSDVVIANVGSTYKTIGSIIQFGSLVDTDSVSTKKNYLLGILDFFDITKYIYVDVPEIKDRNQLELNIYPNPVADILIIKFKNPNKTTSYYQIFDFFGKVIYDGEVSDNYNNSTCTMYWECKDKNDRKLPTGMYVIRFTDGNTSISEKILIK